MSIFLYLLILPSCMASPFYLDLVGEQGLVQLGKVTSPPFSIYQPETGTHQQSRLCHPVVGSTSAPPDEKKPVHNVLVRTITENGTNVPVANSPLLKYPTSYTQIYVSSTFSTWQPNCPTGFHSIGQAGSATKSSPSLNEIICIADQCLETCSPDSNLFKTTDASVWSVKNDTTTAYVSGCNRMTATLAPKPNAFHCLKQDCLRFDPYTTTTPTTTTTTTPYPPNGVHLALGYSITSMSAGWQTMENTSKALTNSIVEYALSPDWLGHAGTSFAIGDVRSFTADPGRTWYSHTVIMTDLKPSTRYYYRVGSNSTLSPVSWSSIFSFESAVDVATLTTTSHVPQKHIIIGDLGSACAFSMCPKCNCSTTVCDATKCNSHANGSDTFTKGLEGGLVRAVQDADMILHVGDYGYNLDDDDGKVGDQFMRNVEQLAAYVPYMAGIGNHEDGATALAHYTERFRQMPTTSGTVSLNNVENGKAPNTWYYSWNAGLVHYVAMSTEIPFGISGNGPDLQGAQYEWITNDLKKANLNRQNVPWIVVFGHRSIYCSCDGDCDASAQTLRDGPFYNATNQNRTWSYEDLFFTNGVDLFINGHEHDYERNYPTYRSHSDLSNVDPKATVYIVTGAAGCDELHEPFTRPQPPRSAFRSNNFGYSQMIIHNHTHLQFQQIMTDPTFFGPADYGRIIDDAMIVQHKHGPFNIHTAPTQNKSKNQTPKVPNVSRDHWAVILKEEFGNQYEITTDNTQELIAKWRKNNPNGIWKKKEDDMKQQFEDAGLGQTKWEDVRMDGSSDGATFGNKKPELIPGIGDPRLNKKKKMEEAQ